MKDLHSCLSECTRACCSSSGLPYSMHFLDREYCYSCMRTAIFSNKVGSWFKFIHYLHTSSSSFPMPLISFYWGTNISRSLVELQKFAIWLYTLCPTHCSPLMFIPKMLYNICRLTTTFLIFSWLCLCINLRKSSCSHIGPHLEAFSHNEEDEIFQDCRISERHFCNILNSSMSSTAQLADMIGWNGEQYLFAVSDLCMLLSLQVPATTLLTNGPG